MDKKKIYNYVMNSPHNTNPNILKSLLNEPTSWNDLKDRPFYEETTEVGGDTLTWDGNTEELLSTDTGNMWLISEAVPTLDDCTDGGSTTVWKDDGAEKVTNLTQAHFMPVIDGVIILGLYFISVAEYASGKVVEELSCTFPKAGVYAMNAGKKQSLTINGYTGFVTTKTMVKPLDEKYLPESVKGGASTTFTINSDTHTIYLADSTTEASSEDIDRAMARGAIYFYSLIDDNKYNAFELEHGNSGYCIFVITKNGYIKVNTVDYASAPS